jgi:hypothetical protein
MCALTALDGTINEERQQSFSVLLTEVMRCDKKFIYPMPHYTNT